MVGVTADILARLFGVSARSVRELASRGIVVKVGRGEYDLDRSVRAYCDHLRETAAGRGGEAVVVALSKQRTRLAREQADREALRNAQARRELLPAAEVEREWSATLKFVQAAMLSLTSRIQQRLGHLSMHDLMTIDQEIRELLSDAAEGVSGAKRLSYSARKSSK